MHVPLPIAIHAPGSAKSVMLWTILPLTIAMLTATSPDDLSLSTQHSLSLQQGAYASVLFLAAPARSANTNLPLQYRFTESGNIPPGMVFESAPCHKPHTKVCSQLASTNGIFLDGTAAQTGSYTFVITATTIDRRTVSKQFTVTVHSPDPRQ